MEPVRRRSVPGEPLPRGKECDPDRFATLLADDVAREMFRCATEPVTVGELATEIDLPPSTAYRKVAALEDAGLLIETRRSSGSDHPSEYVRSVDAVSITHDDSVLVECVTNGVTVCRSEDCEGSS